VALRQTFLRVRTYKMAAKISWHRFGTKLRIQQRYKKLKALWGLRAGFLSCC